MCDPAGAAVGTDVGGGGEAHAGPPVATGAATLVFGAIPDGALIFRIRFSSIKNNNKEGVFFLKP